MERVTRAILSCRHALTFITSFRIQKRKSPVVHVAGIEGIQHLVKNAVRARERSEESHRRAQLQIVREAHDIFNPAALVLQKRLAAPLKPGAEHRMSKVRDSFVPGSNGILLRGRAVAQPCNLRKDVPNPMGLLLPSLQFAEGALIILSLGGEEALQIVLIRFAHLWAPCSRKSSTAAFAPECSAEASGVSPFSFFALMSALMSRSISSPRAAQFPFNGSSFSKDASVRGVPVIV